MEREKLKNILLHYYTLPSANHILRGIRRPSYENILLMNEKHGIPFSAWRDIKSFLREDNTKKSSVRATAKGV